MKKNIFNLFASIIQGIGIALFVIFIVSPLSCHISQEGVEIITGDYQSPKIISCKVVNENTLRFLFSEDVSISALVAKKQDNILINNNIDYQNELNIKSIKKGVNPGELIVEFKDKTDIGCKYEIGGIVQDDCGNSITFSLPFIGYNSKIPKIIITEFFNESTKVSEITHKNKNEYVKILALEDGNLFGLTIGSASWKGNDAYFFPSVNVRKGEEVIVHFNAKGIGCVSEYGSDLDLASELTAKNGIRDLWLDNTKSVFGNKNDVVYIKNLQNNTIVDGFPYYDGERDEWGDELGKWAKRLFDEGVYYSDLITDAINIIPISSTNPLVRSDQQKIINNLKLNIKNETPIKGCKNSWKPKNKL